MYIVGEDRDGNGPDRPVKRQFRGLIRSSKLYIHSVWLIPLSLKIRPVLPAGQVFLARPGSARPVMQYNFLKLAEKKIF
jgi:hypothetical protein